MVKMGGNTFVNCVVPLAFKNHYFLLEPGGTLSISVVYIIDNQPIFEILKNAPVDNALSVVEKSGAGIITVSDKVSGKFLYKVRPDSETSIVFGTVGDADLEAKITDIKLQIGGVTLKNNTFENTRVGVAVEEDGSIVLGGIALPPSLTALLKK